MKISLLVLCSLLATCAIETPHISFPLGKTGYSGYVYAGAGIYQNNLGDGFAK